MQASELEIERVVARYNSISYLRYTHIERIRRIGFAGVFGLYKFDPGSAVTSVAGVEVKRGGQWTHARIYNRCKLAAYTC